MNTTTHKIFNLIILDESGSMEPIKTATLGGFNEMVQTIKGASKQFPEQQHSVTLVTFNGLGITTRLDNVPVDQLSLLTSDQFRPNATTPLYDAMGRSILRQEWLSEKETDYTVLVTILTDGEENASREFAGHQIQALIERLKQQHWLFTYMGSNHAVVETAMSLSIEQSISFHSSIDGVQDVFLQDNLGRMDFYKKRSKGESVAKAGQGYFKKK